jgi:hypothetical protein
MELVGLLHLTFIEHTLVHRCFVDILVDRLSLRWFGCDLQLVLVVSAIEEFQVEELRIEFYCSSVMTVTWRFNAFVLMR